MKTGYACPLSIVHCAHPTDTRTKDETSGGFFWRRRARRKSYDCHPFRHLAIWLSLTTVTEQACRIGVLLPCRSPGDVWPDRSSHSRCLLIIETDETDETDVVPLMVTS